MDLEVLRAYVVEALKRMSAETIASEAKGITGRSVLNFANAGVKVPRHGQRESLEAWARKRQGQGQSPPAADAQTVPLPFIEALRETQENVQTLGAIYGYVKAIRDLMVDVTSRQNGALDMLAPWARMDDKKTAALRAKLTAADKTRPTQTAAKPTRRKSSGQ